MTSEEIATEESIDRPGFRSLDDGGAFDVAPVSRLAIIALILGCFSVLTPLTNVFMLACALAISLGTIAWIKIANNPALSGILPAQIAVALGFGAALWAVTATSGRNHYMYVHAAEHAAVFLEHLSAEKRYEALELLVTEADRQITGTDLEAYYNGEEERKQNADGFLNDEPTLLVFQEGKVAKWEFVRGIGVENTGPNDLVKIEMANTSRKDGLHVVITMQRRTGILIVDEGEPTAHWNVFEMTIQ